MWIEGTFGQLRAGSFDGAMAVMGVYPAGVGAPLHGTLWETYGRVHGASFVGEGAFGLGFDGDASKVAWYFANGRRRESRDILHARSGHGR